MHFQKAVPGRVVERLIGQPGCDEEQDEGYARQQLARAQESIIPPQKQHETRRAEETPWMRQYGEGEARRREDALEPGDSAPAEGCLEQNAECKQHEGSCQQLRPHIHAVVEQKSRKNEKAENLPDAPGGSP